MKSIVWNGDKVVTQNFHSGHDGIDIALNYEPVYALRDGLVLWTGPDKYGGEYLWLLHDDGTGSSYVHLQKGSYLVAKGQRVSKGQQIATSGNTGLSSGPHLHFVFLTNGRAYSGQVDPRPYLELNEDNQPIPNMDFTIGKKIKVTLAQGDQLWVRTGSGISFPEVLPRLKGGVVFEVISGTRPYGTKLNPATGKYDLKTDNYTWVNGRTLEGSTFWAPYQEGWMANTDESLTFQDGSKPTPPPQPEPTPDYKKLLDEANEKLRLKDEAIAQKDSQILDLNKKIKELETNPVEKSNFKIEFDVKDNKVTNVNLE